MSLIQNASNKKPQEQNCNSKGNQMDHIAITRTAAINEGTTRSQKTPAILREWLLALPRSQKRLLQLTADTLLIWLSLTLAFYLRFDDINMIEPLGGHAWLFILAPILALPLFARFGLYRAVMRYFGYQAFTNVVLSVTASTIFLTLAILLYSDPPAVIPRSLPIIYWLLNLVLVGGLRLVMRQYFRGLPLDLHIPSFIHAKKAKQNAQLFVAIYGAGAAGNQLLMALRAGSALHPVAFVDDNPELTGRVIAGLPVYSPQSFSPLISEKHIQEVLLAIPSASRAKRTQIIHFLATYPVRVRTIPGFMDLASGRVQVQDIREVDIGDLLGRDPVQPNPQLFERCVRGQVVMVTGAGGSIGSELCRQIIGIEPHTLILFEQSEFNLYSIQSELEAHIKKCQGHKIRLVSILSSVRNQNRLLDVMSSWRVNTVYHAAAYKHVPMVERNSVEGIVNNIFGTLYSAQAAIRAGVSNFVLISTDKAVRPTNTMGSTKRLAEMVLQALSAEPMPTLYDAKSPDGITAANRTRFTMVRFGNVLDSSGSVIPLFRKQIREGGPVTVTHPDITRYFMTIPEAAQLVIQAGAMGKGGDVFVLDMGDPIKIVDLANKMILLSGLSARSAQNPDGDIAIEFVGLRPGEKLFEELLIGDNVAATEHAMIMRANEAGMEWAALKSALTDLMDAINEGDYMHIRELFFQLVDGYAPDKNLVDWIHLQRSLNSVRPEESKKIAEVYTPG